jgi:hypothetical protein
MKVGEDDRPPQTLQQNLGDLWEKGLGPMESGHVASAAMGREYTSQRNRKCIRRFRY